MIEYRKLAIPAIFILILGGVISFFLAFTFYPEKHVNVSIDGKCYELINYMFILTILMGLVLFPFYLIHRTLFHIRQTTEK